MYEPRWYRTMMEGNRFISFQTTYLETDLWIGIDEPSFHPSLPDFAYHEILRLRKVLNEYMAIKPRFLTSLEPLPSDGNAPPEIQSMISCTQKSETGPMSAIAGQFAQTVGEAIREKYKVKEILIENGGDIYACIDHPLDVSVYAGTSPLSNKIIVEIPEKFSPLGICTSSGTVGHSLSFGKADAVMVACKSTPLADAWATRLCNEVKTPADISRVLQLTETIPDILSIVIVAGDQTGIRGQFFLKPAGK